mmetsp:Transcript_24396/g.53170  ORF Transcript_24396/g.53170 Transcript_24396/m.53170 type:complete len:262 (+) Transcript_24396:599-1384(+)
MCHSGDHVLVRLIYFQSYHNCISRLLQTGFKAAKIGSTKCSCHLKAVIGVSLLVANKQITPKRGTGRCIQIQRTKSVSRTVIAARIENQLHALNASCIEGSTANRLTRWKAFPKKTCLFHSPLNSPYHSGSHGVHLVLHLVKETVVDMPSEQQRSRQLFLCQFVGLLLLSLRSVLELLIGGWLDGLADVLHLSDCFQDLAAYSQSVVLSVDLVFQPAETGGSIGHLPVEDFLAGLRFASTVEFVHQVHPLARPQVDGNISR